MLRNFGELSRGERETAELRKKIVQRPSVSTNHKGYTDSYFLKCASGWRKRDRLSVDIFHGKRELSRIHGCSAREKEEIKSARFDSYLGKNKNDFTFSDFSQVVRYNGITS